MSKTLLLFTLFSLLIYFRGNTQDSLWSLERCIQYALENNIQVKQQEVNTRYNKNNLIQSKVDLVPNLNAGISHSYSYGRTLDETTYEYTDNETVRSNNMGVSSSVTLFNGFQKINQIKQKEFDLLASLEDLQQIKNNVSLNIASAFLTILFNIELLNVSKEQLAITSQQVNRTLKLVEAGSLAKGNLLEIQAQAAAEELNVINAKNQLDISYLVLTQLLELESVDNFEIRIPENLIIQENNMLDYSTDSIYAQAENIMPQIRGAEYRLKSSEKYLSIAKGAVSPKLALTGSYGSLYSSIRKKQSGTEDATVPIGQTLSGEGVVAITEVPVFEDYNFMSQIKDNANTNISFDLSIPIFNGFMVKNNIDNAKLSILNAKYELENQKNILYKDIQQANADAIAALNKYEATDKALIAMQESFRYTEEKFEVGLVNTVDYNAAKNQLAQTASDLLQAKYEYIFKTKILEFYKGIPIKL